MVMRRPHSTVAVSGRRHKTATGVSSSKRSKSTQTDPKYYVDDKEKDEERSNRGPDHGRNWIRQSLPSISNDDHMFVKTAVFSHTVRAPCPDRDDSSGTNVASNRPISNTRYVEIVEDEPLIDVSDPIVVKTTHDTSSSSCSAHTNSSESTIRKALAAYYVPYKQKRPGCAFDDLQARLQTNLQTIKDRMKR